MYPRMETKRYYTVNLGTIPNILNNGSLSLSLY